MPDRLKLCFRRIIIISALYPATIKSVLDSMHIIRFAPIRWVEDLFNNLHQPRPQLDASGSTAVLLTHIE